jgi:Zn-dependent protease with chaperone function
LAERIVEQLEASPSGCVAVPATHPRRKTVEADLVRFQRAVPVPPHVRFEVMDCTVDGFVYKGQTVVLSVRLARLTPAQRFFIIAHEMGHIALQHHAVMSSFVARAVDSSADEAAARAAVASGLTAISHRNELEADGYAVRVMREAGLNAEEAARLFDSIGEGQDNATHPSAGRRARAIRAAM